MKRLLISISLLALAGLTFAQFDIGDSFASKPAWEQFTLPKKTLKLDFRNASVDAVVSLFSKTSGITIVKDPSLKEPMTITSAKAVSLKEAFQIFSTALSLRNFDLKKEGNLMVIRAKPQGGGRPDMGAMMQMMQGQQGERSELRVYPIQFANSAQVARVINDVFAQAGQNNTPQFQFPGGGGMIQFGGGGQGGRFGGGQGGRGGQGRQGSTVRASSDDYSNTVIVNAPDREQGQVEELIKQIDKRTEEPLQPKVYKLEFADASSVAPVVQNVLTANAPKGRGGQGTQNVPFEQRFQQAARLGSFQASFGTVVADTRTNSLVISATQENHDLVDKVIKELDTEIKVENSTFVFPLDNARADQVANLITQAFGTRTGGQRQGNFGQNNNQNRNNQNRNNQNRNQNIRLGGLGGNNTSQDQLQKELELELQDPNVDAGELQTNIGVSQGIFFGGGGQGGQNQNRTGSQVGRDSQGRLVNVQDLTNQITVIPDPNTNSLIVVASPENADVIRNILAQLDKIPEQVMIETIIVEATLDSSSRMGVEWSFIQDKAFGTPGATGVIESAFGQQAANPSGFRYTLAAGTLSAFVNAFQSDSKFQVLSTPRIFTSNNAPAQINISQRVPFVVSQREDANGNLTFNYDFEDVGIVLDVTPQITANGYVTMDVQQTANDLQGFTDFNAPIVNQRTANTRVAVKDGETIILGGIMRTTVNATTRKIPLLGDIPILGNLFKTTTREKAKTELMVFLTPRVVRNPDEAKSLREGEQNKLSKPSQDELKKIIPPPSTGGGQQNPSNGGGKG